MLWPQDNTYLSKLSHLLMCIMPFNLQMLHLVLVKGMRNDMQKELNKGTLILTAYYQIKFCS